jgi:hypothetical protein
MNLYAAISQSTRFANGGSLGGAAARNQVEGISRIMSAGTEFETIVP